jgi:hypothetical protein
MLCDTKPRRSVTRATRNVLDLHGESNNISENRHYARFGLRFFGFADIGLLS